MAFLARDSMLGNTLFAKEITLQNPLLWTSVSRALREQQWQRTSRDLINMDVFCDFIGHNPLDFIGLIVFTSPAPFIQCGT